MLADIISGIKPYRRLSAFYYYIGNYPLKNGMNWLYFLVLLALAVLFLGATLFLFDRRDLTVYRVRSCFLRSCSPGQGSCLWWNAKG